MPRTRKLRSVLAFLALCLLVLPGCGKSGAVIKGTLILPPNVKLNDTDSVTISFVPEDMKGQAYPAAFSISENSFVAEGPRKKGIPAGKYKIVLELHPYRGSPDSASRASFFDQFNQYYNAGSTKLTYEVTSDSTQSITIDLVQGTVTKN
jgi:predicted small lipoprotein YifL